MSESKWWSRSWNPIAVCSPLSPGCRNCYAARLAATRLVHLQQYKGLAGIDDSGERERLSHWTGEVGVNEKALAKGAPLCRGVLFVGDMGDLFHEKVPSAVIHRVLESCDATREGTIPLVLTKRPGRMHDELRAYCAERGATKVWCGVTAEDRERWSERVPILMDTPCAGRVVSIEPMIDPVRVLCAKCGQDSAWHIGRRDDCPGSFPDWVIVGGEAGPRARPCDENWFVSVGLDCRAAGISMWIKQLGSHPTCNGHPFQLHDRRGADPSEWPEDLRVRQTPWGGPAC